MIQSADPLDRVVEDYLAAVARAGEDLPAGRREELVGDLREHISVARAELVTPTEAAVRTILERLGDPSIIVQEARVHEMLTPVSAPSPGPQASPSISRPRISPLTLAVVLGLVLIVIVLGVGVLALIQQGVAPIEPGVEAPLPVR